MRLPTFTTISVRAARSALSAIARLVSEAVCLATYDHEPSRAYYDDAIGKWVFECERCAHREVPARITRAHIERLDEIGR